MHLNDVPFDAGDAVGLRVFPKVGRQEPASKWKPYEYSDKTDRRSGTGGAKLRIFAAAVATEYLRCRRVAEPAQLHPIVMKRHGLEPGSDRAEGVKISVALPPPVRKPGAQPECSPGLLRVRSASLIPSRPFNR